MYHYVYRLDHIETGEFYIGSRSSKYHPTMDKYMGSMVSWKPDKSKLIKKIIKDDFKNREDAIKYEAVLITENIKDSLNRNFHIPGKGFHTVGLTTVKDLSGNTFNVLLDDPRYLSGELVPILTGKVIVFDSNGIGSRVFKTDPRYLSGELIHSTTGTVLVKDENNIITRISINDPRYLSGKLIPIWTDRKHSIETKNKIGIKNSNKQKGEKNSQFGTCWVTNGVENKKIKNNKQIPDGWVRGRTLKNKL